MKFNRRNVLIGLGSIAAGAGTLAGTGAFTSVTAERSADIRVAGDGDALLGVVPVANSDNSAYVSQTNGTVGLDINGGSGTSGTGVNDNAVTQLENLFKIINQGTQSVNFYFEDESDAVTFRVSRSTDTSTNGTAGQSLEGADNSITLGVGEQVVVGLTVDTLNNDVSGQLLENVTLVADADASAPQQSGPTPRYVVDGTGDAPNTFKSISAALGSDGFEPGTVVGIEGGVTLQPSSPILLDESVTLVGLDGMPTIDAQGLGGGEGSINVASSDVTLRNFELLYDDTANGIEANEAGNANIVVDGLRVEDTAGLTGRPALNFEKARNITVTNNEVIGGAIGTFFSDSESTTETIVGNFVDLKSSGAPTQNGPTEGIFSFGSGLSNKDLVTRDNRVENQPDTEEEIKVVTTEPASLNGQTKKADQLEALLTDNAVSFVQLTGSEGRLVTEESIGTQYATVADVLGGTPGGLTLFEDGEYDLTERVDISAAGFTVRGMGDVELAYTGGTRGDNQNVTTGRGIELTGSGISLENLSLVYTGPVVNSNNGGDVFTVVDAEGVTLSNIEMFGDFSETGGSHPSFVRIATAGSGSGRVVIEDSIFDQDSEIGDTFVAPRPFADDAANDGEVLIENNEFLTGVRVGPNLNAGQTLTIRGNHFQSDAFGDALPGGSFQENEGTLVIGDNTFDMSSMSSNPEIKITTIPDSVNGTNYDGSNDSQIASVLSQDNGSVDARAGSATAP
jgi:hypothetical protein